MQTEFAWEPLHAWTVAQREQVAALVDSAWRAWQAAWLPEGPSQEPAACVDADDVAGASSHDWCAVGHTVWIRGVDAAVLEHEIFGTGGTSPMARSVAQRARDAMFSALARTLVAPSAGGYVHGVPTARVFERWSGALIVSLPGAFETQLLIDAPRLATLVERKAVVSMLPPLETVARAIDAKRLKLDVELATCELTLGALGALHLGDVIPFSHSLDEPMTVTHEGQVICSAFLGRSQGSKAVELVRGSAFPLEILEQRAVA